MILKRRRETILGELTYRIGKKNLSKVTTDDAQLLLLEEIRHLLMELVNNQREQSGKIPLLPDKETYPYIKDGEKHFVKYQRPI